MSTGVTPPCARLPERLYESTLYWSAPLLPRDPVSLLGRSRRASPNERDKHPKRFYKTNKGTRRLLRAPYLDRRRIWPHPIGAALGRTLPHRRCTPAGPNEPASARTSGIRRALGCSGSIFRGYEPAQQLS